MWRTLTLAGVLVCGAMLTGCAADTTPLETFGQGAAPTAQTEAAPRTFKVQLRGGTTAETVIPAILASGHDQLAAACAGGQGEGSIRIFNPLDSRETIDVACSEILDGTAETSAALTSNVDGPIGTARQKWSPFGLVCSALLLGATLAWNWPWGQEGCNSPSAENPTGCKVVTGLGGGGLGLLCAFI